MTAETRQLASGDNITVDLLRDFLLATLRHDAIRDVLMEQVVAAIEDGYPSDQLRVGVLSSELQVLIAEVMSAAERADWRAVASLLIEDTRGELEEIGGGEQ